MIVLTADIASYINDLVSYCRQVIETTYRCDELTSRRN